MLKQLEERNQKIIDAVIKKANRDYPGTLALIGIYGSFMTGDIHEKSDLDLLILINDDRGWQLGCAFVQDDLQVGHDIYCTNWESLEYDAGYHHPNISKLMDSKIVYCADEKYLEKLDTLRKKVQEKLRQPFSKEDYEKAEEVLKEAEHFFTKAMVAEELSDVRSEAGNMLYYVESAIALLNKKYFRYGTKRVYEELAQMERRPANLCEMLEEVVSADSSGQMKQALTALMKEMFWVFEKAKEEVFANESKKQAVSADAVRGTYEEMYSNWRNKMYLAAKENHKHLAFFSMSSLSGMLGEIEQEVAIAPQEVFAYYHPNDLQKTAEGYDVILQKYLKEYESVNLQPRHYADVDTFVADYLEENHDK